MWQYYSQEGSQSLPESTRQTDCLFLEGQTAGPGAGSAASWLHGQDTENNPEKALFFSSFASV